MITFVLDAGPRLITSLNSNNFDIDHQFIFEVNLVFKADGVFLGLLEKTYFEAFFDEI